MTLFNIKQLIVIIYIISLSQCLGYIVLMSSEGYRYGHQLQNPLPYYTNEEDIISSNDDASIYDGESGEYIDYHVSPYENVIDDTNPYQNDEYEEGEAYSQDYPNVDYQTYNDENSQYYGPVEYNNMQYDQSSYDYNIPYNAYYSRRDTNDYYQERPDIQYRVSLGNRPYQYQEDYDDDDDADDYYSNEGNYEDDYNSNNDNYKSQSDSNVNFRQYYKLPTASYKHQKYVPHRLDTLKDYQPIDDKLYVFYPKDIKPQYYTLRKMHTKHGNLNPYFSSRIISKKSPNGYFKNVLPTTYQSDDHHKHRDNSMHSNKNNHYYYKSINKSPNYKSIDNYSPTSNYKDHHLNGRSSSYYRNNNKNEYRPSKSKVSYPTTNNKKNKPLRDVYGNSMRTTDYEETISYHKSGEKGPKGKMKSYSSYDIYGHLKHTGKSKLGSGITRYHTVIDSDKSKNRHYVTYQPLNNEYNK